MWARRNNPTTLPCWDCVTLDESLSEPPHKATNDIRNDYVKKQSPCGFNRHMGASFLFICFFKTGSEPFPFSDVIAVDPALDPAILLIVIFYFVP